MQKSIQALGYIDASSTNTNNQIFYSTTDTTKVVVPINANHQVVAMRTQFLVVGSTLYQIVVSDAFTRLALIDYNELSNIPQKYTGSTVNVISKAFADFGITSDCSTCDEQFCKYYASPWYGLTKKIDANGKYMYVVSSNIAVLDRTRKWLFGFAKSMPAQISNQTFVGTRVIYDNDNWQIEEFLNYSYSRTNHYEVSSAPVYLIGSLNYNDTHYHVTYSNGPTIDFNIPADAISSGIITVASSQQADDASIVNILYSDAPIDAAQMQYQDNDVVNEQFNIYVVGNVYDTNIHEIIDLTRDYTFNTGEYIIPVEIVRDGYVKPVKYKTIEKTEDHHIIRVLKQRKFPFGGKPIKFLASDLEFADFESNFDDTASESKTIDITELNSFDDKLIYTSNGIYPKTIDYWKELANAKMTDISVPAGKKVVFIKSDDKYFVPVNNDGVIKPYFTLGRNAGYLVLAIDSDEDVNLVEVDRDVMSWDLGWQDVTPAPDDILNSPSTSSTVDDEAEIWRWIQSSSTSTNYERYTLKDGYYYWNDDGNDYAFYYYSFKHLPRTTIALVDLPLLSVDVWLSLKTTNAFWFSPLGTSNPYPDNWLNIGNPDDKFILYGNVNNYTDNSGIIAYIGNTTNILDTSTTNSDPTFNYRTSLFTVKRLYGDETGELKFLVSMYNVYEVYDYLSPIDTYTTSSLTTTPTPPQETITIIEPYTPIGTETDVEISEGKHILVVRDASGYYVPAYQDTDGKWKVVDYQSMKGDELTVVVADVPAGKIAKLFKTEKKVWEKEIGEKIVDTVKIKNLFTKVPSTKTYKLCNSYLWHENVSGGNVSYEDTYYILEQAYASYNCSKSVMWLTKVDGPLFVYQLNIDGNNIAWWRQYSDNNDFSIHTSSKSANGFSVNNADVVHVVRLDTTVIWNAYSINNSFSFNTDISPTNCIGYSIGVPADTQTKVYQNDFMLLPSDYITATITPVSPTLTANTYPLVLDALDTSVSQETNISEQYSENITISTNITNDFTDNISMDTTIVTTEQTMLDSHITSYITTNTQLDTHIKTDNGYSTILDTHILAYNNAGTNLDTTIHAFARGVTRLDVDIQLVEQDSIYLDTHIRAASFNHTYLDTKITATTHGVTRLDTAIHAGIAYHVNIDNKDVITYAYDVVIDNIDTIYNEAKVNVDNEDKISNEYHVAIDNTDIISEYDIGEDLPQYKVQVKTKLPKIYQGNTYVLNYQVLVNKIPMTTLRIGYQLDAYMQDLRTGRVYPDFVELHDNYVRITPMLAGEFVLVFAIKWHDDETNKDYSTVIGRLLITVLGKMNTHVID